jgi:hypothetical protein
VAGEYRRLVDAYREADRGLRDYLGLRRVLWSYKLWSGEYRTTATGPRYSMGRRSTPERIYQARRAAMVSRLMQAGRRSPAAAEALVTAWESEAASRGLDRFSDAYRDEAEGWLARQTS